MIKIKSDGNALELWTSNRERMKNCYVFRDATRHFRKNELVGALYRIRDYKVEKLDLTIEPKWVKDNTLTSCLLGIEGWEADYLIVSESEAKRILITWNTDPSILD